MKKQLTTLFLMAAVLLMPLSLTSCGEDVQLNENGGENNGGKPKTGTKFSSRPSGTRTSLSSTADANNKFPFYWETGDNIFVDEKKDGTFTLPSSRLEIDASDKNLADFFFQKVLTEKKYDLVYTGNASTNANEVTIKKEQVQTAQNSSAHLGTSGDCATATATQDAIGDYSFELEHKASYLIFQPYKKSDITATWTLVGIEIITDGTTKVAGTYSFSMSGLSASPTSNASDTVKLDCSAVNYALQTSSADAFFAVIQPGTHNLTIRYKIRPSGSANGVAGGTFYAIKTIDRTFNVGGVTTIQHELDVLRFRRQSYMWDAPVGSYFIFGNNNHSTIEAPTQATRSCKGMPNANEMYWYVKNGDARWDNMTAWTLDAGANVYCAGAWVKKKAAILAEGKTFDATKTNLSGNGLSNLDLRKNGPWTDAQFTNMLNNEIIIRVSENTSIGYKTGGRPADTTDYFYLPAMGYNGNVTGNLSNVGSIGYFWSKSPFPVPGAQNPKQFSYYFAVSAARITLNVAGDRTAGITVSISTSDNPVGITYFE